MKNKFKGIIHNEIPDNWDELTKEDPRIRKSLLETLKYSSNTPFVCITHPEYVCCEYKMKLNLFAFRKHGISIPFNVIGMPVSVSSCGFRGNIDALLDDYKTRKGLFLILNLNSEQIEIVRRRGDIATGQTLATCIFENTFTDFPNYLSSLRSEYRRRLKIALRKGENLKTAIIDNKLFDAKLHNLYLQVQKRSKYPLETLGIEFFRNFEGEIHVFYDNTIKNCELEYTKNNNENISENEIDKFSSDENNDAMFSRYDSSERNHGNNNNSNNSKVSSENKFESAGATTSSINYKEGAIKTSLAFVMITYEEKQMDFIFGGMDYEKRDQYDLYYNMLLHIARIGIENGVSRIDFGQTAEQSKCKIGCKISHKYMASFSNNKLLNYILQKSASLLEYKNPIETYKTFK